MGWDDVEDEIRRRLEEGIEVTADDFAGWECATCDNQIPFDEVIEDRDAVVTWDIIVQDPGEDPEGHYARYYFCSESCRTDARHNPGETIDECEPDLVEEKGMPVLSEGPR